MYLIFYGHSVKKILNQEIQDACYNDKKSDKNN